MDENEFYKSIENLNGFIKIPRSLITKKNIYMALMHIYANIVRDRTGCSYLNFERMRYYGIIDVGQRKRRIVNEIFKEYISHYESGDEYGCVSLDSFDINDSRFARITYGEVALILETIKDSGFKINDVMFLLLYVRMNSIRRKDSDSGYDWMRSFKPNVYMSYYTVMASKLNMKREKISSIIQYLEDINIIRTRRSDEIVSTFGDDNSIKVGILIIASYNDDYESEINGAIEYIKKNGEKESITDGDDDDKESEDASEISPPDYNRISERKPEVMNELRSIFGDEFEDDGMLNGLNDDELSMVASSIKKLN